MFDVNTITYFILMNTLRILGMIPRKWSYRLGNLIGMAVFHLDKKHRGIAIDNLVHAFGHERDRYEIKTIAREVFKNLSQILFEIGWSLKLTKSDFHEHFYLDGVSHYRRAFEKGKGVLLLTAHAGNWELLPIIAAMAEIPGNVLFRPLDFSPLNRLFRELRSRYGAKVIPTSGSMRKILKVLKRGECIGMLGDGDVDVIQAVATACRS